MVAAKEEGGLLQAKRVYRRLKGREKRRKIRMAINFTASILPPFASLLVGILYAMET